MTENTSAQTADHAMKLSPVSTPRATQPAGPYSQAISAGELLFVSGQRPTDPATGAIPEGITEQSHAVLSNLIEVLTAGGCSPADVVKASVHLADLRFFDEFNAVYKQYFSPPYPARTTVGSQLRGILVEVDAIAVRRSPAEAQS
jgi:2-iminobutanoate/2-iminopropanoate deaminase